MPTQPSPTRTRLPFFDASLGCYRVPLRDGRTALVDSADLQHAAGEMWCVTHSGSREYVRTRDKAGTPYLARRVLGLTGNSLRIKYLNDNHLDLRRANLRVQSFGEMVQGYPKRGKNPQSRFKGVAWDGRFWAATITLDMRRTPLGRFTTEEDAAKAYDAAARSYYGAHARVNLPAETGPIVTPQEFL